MLPSTGYFKGINCPFYDSGLCERPYCHFRHVRKDSVANPANEGIESGAILQKLVSAAVQRVLQQTEASASGSTQGVSPVGATENSKLNNVVPSKATYNPTPISQLNKINSVSLEESDDLSEQRKRHIPVPYTPRKPASIAFKRPIETNGSTKPFIYIPPPVKYTPGGADSAKVDPYTPKGSIESTEQYLPGVEKEVQEYIVKETQSSSKHNYVPSDKKYNKKKKVLEYKPTKVSSNTEKPSVTYQPTPRSLAPCFSSDEDEPEVKKPKLSNDFNSLDDLGPEFDILDQILDEEKSEPSKKSDISLLDVPTEKQSSIKSDGLSIEEKLGKKISDSQLESDSEKQGLNLHRSSNEEKAGGKKYSNDIDSEKQGLKLHRSNNEERAGGKKSSDSHHEIDSAKKKRLKLPRSSNEDKAGGKKSSNSHHDADSQKQGLKLHRSSYEEKAGGKKSSNSQYELVSEKQGFKLHRSSNEEKPGGKKPSNSQLEEKSEKQGSKSDDKTENVRSSEHKKSVEHHKKHKSSDKKEFHKSHKKSKSETSKDKSNKQSKSESHTKKSSESSHKSSSRDKSKEKHEKSSKKDNHSSKHSKHNNYGSFTEKSSKHSSSSRHKDKKSHYKYSREDSDSKHSKENKKLKKNEEPNSDHNNDSDADFDQRDEDLYNISSESDEDAIAEECKRIFEEYIPEKKICVEPDQATLDNDNNDLESEYVPTKKRISRTTDVKVLPKPPVKPDFKVSAALAMAERLSKVREFHASKNINTTTKEIHTLNTEPSKSTFTPAHMGHSKIRIAHVPYASTMMSAKKTIAPSTKKEEPAANTTLAQTIKKGAQRVAHIPSDKFIDRPGVLEPLASKIPANIRSTYLNMMIDECLKIYLSATDAYARAQHEELATSKKCSTVQIYKNSAVLAVSRLRKELQECNGVKKCGSECTALQKIPQTVSGHTSQAGSWSIENKSRRTYDNSHEFTGAKLYSNIQKWVLSEEQLRENGFPRPHESGEKGRAIIYSQNKQKPPKGFIRTCCRCRKDYTIDKKGFPAVKEECVYHPNNKYRVRGEARYQCCSQDGFSDGCCVAPCHVYEYVDFENLKGFVTTLPPTREMDDYGVYSLDCEMCYTTHGLDLTRVTVINSACKVVYETLIKPLHPIIDYNTRYSGITEEQMANVRTTLLEVQATLLAMFSSKTILIGHSLESDFKALKLIHDSVIDTSVLFPHKMGPPYKRALRNLCSEYLKKIIQNSVDGHDSAEDARACMELIIYKLKEDLKTR